MSNGWMPFGGHTQPIAIDGDKLRWKKAQKKSKKKNITSETMKNSIPNFKPLRTAFVWWPWPDSITIWINQVSKTYCEEKQTVWIQNSSIGHVCKEIGMKIL